MTTNLVKDRYEARRRRLHRLPSIDEEPTAISRILNRYAEKVIRSPRYNNPVFIQRIENPDLETRIYLDQLKERKYASTRDIVGDYMHFARYGHHIPLHGTLEETNTQGVCPCCTDRNFENAKLSKTPRKPVEGDKKVSEAEAGETIVETELSSERAIAKFSVPKAGGYAIEHTGTPRDVTTWLDYQPQPYVKHYLSPEYNRPTVVIDYLAKQAMTSRKTHTDGKKLVKASTKYVDSMNKLGDTVSYLNGPLEYQAKPIAVDASFPKLSDYELDKYRDLPIPYSDRGMYRPVLGNPRRRYGIDRDDYTVRKIPRPTFRSDRIIDLDDDSQLRAKYAGIYNSPRMRDRYSVMSDPEDISPRTYRGLNDDASPRVRSRQDPSFGSEVRNSREQPSNPNYRLESIQMTPRKKSRHVRFQDEPTKDFWRYS